MKSKFLLLISLTFAFCACHHKSDPLFGTWTVDKVNVQFDEHHNTPELVKQIGEMERQNVITIGSDSIMTFKGLDESLQGTLSINSDGTLLLDGTLFGQWKDGSLTTQTTSPLGEVVVRYKKVK